MTDALLKTLVVAVPLLIPAFAVYWFFTSRSKAARYGMFMIPGETTVALPSGKLRISYQEEYRAGHRATGEHIKFCVPAALRVSVTNAATGEELPIKEGAALDTGNGWSRALIGKVLLTEPGTYTVTASPDVGGIEAKILLGK